MTPPLGTDSRGGAFGSYLAAARSHLLLIALITLAAIGGSLVWLSQRSPTYEATTRVLVNPLPADDRNFLGIAFVRESGDPVRTVQTAAQLIDTPQAAALTATRIGRTTSAQEIEDAVTVQPQGQSDVLAVTAKADDPQLAVRIANEFTRASFDVRREVLQRQIAGAIDKARAQRNDLSSPRSTTATSLYDRIDQLSTVRDGTDPTLSISQLATPPTGSSGAPSWLIVLLAGVAGLALGLGVALVVEQLERRVRDEDEALELYPLPVLARLAPLPRRRGGQGLLDVPPANLEGYRMLRVQLEAGEGEHRTIMVTSASSEDGKTTTVIQFAVALASLGQRVVVFDLDLRKPDLARSLGVTSEGGGLVKLLETGDDAGNATELSDALVRVPGAPLIQVLPAGGPLHAIHLEMLDRQLRRLLMHARFVADYVLIDTSPLGEVSDAVRMAREVDQMILLVRPGHTHRGNFELVRELLERTGQRPAGLVTVGAAPKSTSVYYSDRRDGAGTLRHDVPASAVRS